MTAKRERIVSFTADEMRALERDRKAGTDWKQAARAPLPDGSDPDDAMEPVDMDWLSTELPKPRRKTLASLRLDSDMLDWFRAQGRGYQTKINAVLRSYFEQHTR